MSRKSMLHIGEPKMTVKVLILWSSISTDAHTRRLEDLLISKKCDIEKIDGAEPFNKGFRNELFTISGLGAEYPQCFINNNGIYEYVGQWEAVETLEECDSIPAEILAAHPEIKTFTSVFFKQIEKEKQERAMATYLAEEEEFLIAGQDLERSKKMNCCFKFGFDIS